MPCPGPSKIYSWFFSHSGFDWYFISSEADMHRYSCDVQLENSLYEYQMMFRNVDQDHTLFS